MALNERSVEVDREPLGGDAEIPGMLARLRVRRAQGIEQLGLSGDPLDHPVGGRIRGDLAEQGRLVAHRAEVAERIAAVGEHHRQVTDDAAGVVARASLTHPTEP